MWISLGDAKCSGLTDCELDVHELIKYSKPCPVELSSYLEASFTCVHGNIKASIYFLFKALQTRNVRESLRAKLKSMNCSNIQGLAR